MPVIEQLHLENFSAFHQLKLDKLGQLNVVIGLNDTGKTHLLKTLYAVVRSIQDFHKKGESPAPGNFEEILEQKLLWTFLPRPFELRELATKTKSILKILIKFSQNREVLFDSEFYPGEYGTEGSSTVQDENILSKLKSLKGIFIPAKEILTLFKAIEQTREGKELGAFDDTYYDLVKDFRLDTLIGKESKNSQDAWPELQKMKKEIAEGDVHYQQQELTYVKNKERYSIHQAAEGIRKVAVVERLLRNGQLNTTDECILFLDEPETSLHPQAIIRFAELLASLAKAGIQVFLTTHSYFMMKRLEQIAREWERDDFLLIDLRRNLDTQQVECQTQNLRHGMTDNPIVEQSLWLYDRDVDLMFGTK